MTDTFDPFASPETIKPLSEEWAARRRVADAARQLILNLVTSTDTAEELASIAENIEQQATRLSHSRRAFGMTAFERRDAERFGDRFQLQYELSPLTGKCNPIAPPFEIWIDEERSHAKVHMDWQYEGPPNSVHGGWVAALFDHFLGVTQRLTKQPGFTGTLSVRYIKPTPIDTELRLEGWVEKIEGRKNFLVGEMWAGETMTARCEGIFISVDKAAVEALKNRYDDDTQ